MKVISTTLKLACSPLAFNDIAWAKHDVDFKDAVGKARVYMVAKKSRLCFRNVKVVGNRIALDISDDLGSVSITIPSNEPIFKPSDKKTLVLDVGFKECHILAKNEEFAKTYGIRFYEVDEAFYKKASDKELKKCLDDDSFVAWLTPEKMLYLYSKKLLRIPNFDKTKNFFWNYEVVRIGKVTSPAALKKRKVRESFLEILESEIEDDEDFRDEAVLLFFDVFERDNSLLIGNSMSVNEFQVPLNGEELPSMELLSLKTENALLHKFKPKYNAVLFKNPEIEESDSSEYDITDYAISDSITLMLKRLNWVGGPDGDCLVYCKGDGLSVMKPASFDEFLEKKFIEDVLSY